MNRLYPFLTLLPLKAYMFIDIYILYSWPNSGLKIHWNRTGFNPLSTNDAHMRHGLSTNHKDLYGGFNTRRYTSVHGFCLF